MNEKSDDVEAAHRGWAEPRKASRLGFTRAPQASCSACISRVRAVQLYCQGLLGACVTGWPRSHEVFGRARDLGALAQVLVPLALWSSCACMRGRDQQIKVGCHVLGALTGAVAAPGRQHSGVLMAWRAAAVRQL